MKQRTIQDDIAISGIGLHTGVETTVKVIPAAPNTGYLFVRKDIEGHKGIKAIASNVFSTNRGTSIQKDGVEIHTIEHLLSAIYALGIDNAIVEMEGPELPILDGSAKAYAELIKQVGTMEQDAEAKIFKVEDAIHVKDSQSGSEIMAVPSDDFEITTLIDFDSDIIGEQFAEFNSQVDYVKEIAPNRTFVFVRDIETLMDMGLIKGGSLQNALVIADEIIKESTLNRLSERLDNREVSVTEKGILNTSELRFNNEPARHKLLDLIGDLALLGCRFQGKIIAKKPGHGINVKFAKACMEAYKKQSRRANVPDYDPSAKPLYTTEDIINTLPHRFPFVLVDKIIHLSETEVVGIKNVTFDEYFFQGHFPNQPIFPGVLQLEALAQTGGILALSQVEEPQFWDTYFVKVDKVKFKHKVVPGDTLIMRMKLLSPIRRGICFMKAEAYVGDRLVSEGELTAQIVKRSK